MNFIKKCSIFHSKRGFTLIELIIVITITVILISILLPFTLGYINTARIQSHRVSARTIYDMSIHAIGLEPSLGCGGDPEAAEPKIKQYIYDHDDLTQSGIDILNDPKIKIYYNSHENILWAEYHGIRFPTQYVEDPDNEEIDD